MAGLGRSGHWMWCGWEGCADSRQPSAISRQVTGLFLGALAIHLRLSVKSSFISAWRRKRAGSEMGRAPSLRWFCYVRNSFCTRVGFYAGAAGGGCGGYGFLCRAGAACPWSFAVGSIRWRTCVLRAFSWRWAWSVRDAGCSVRGDLDQHATGISAEAGIGIGGTARGTECGAGSGESCGCVGWGIDFWRHGE